MHQNYGSDYGLGTCKAHDERRPPSCSFGRDHCFLDLEDGDLDTSTLLAQLWCFDPWCYVNGSDCALPSERTGSGGFFMLGLNDTAGDLHYRSLGPMRDRDTAHTGALSRRPPRPRVCAATPRAAFLATFILRPTRHRPSRMPPPLHAAELTPFAHGFSLAPPPSPSSLSYRLSGATCARCGCAAL